MLCKYAFLVMYFDKLCFLCLCVYVQRSVTKLRLGLNLEIFHIRYEGRPIPPEERFCKVCDSGSVDDEMHFVVLVCNHFVDERQYFIQRYFREHPSELKFCQLLQSSENVTLKNLSKCKKRFFSSVDILFVVL